MQCTEQLETLHVDLAGDFERTMGDEFGKSQAVTKEELTALKERLKTLQEAARGGEAAVKKICDGKSSSQLCSAGS